MLCSPCYFPGDIADSIGCKVQKGLGPRKPIQKDMVIGWQAKAYRHQDDWGVCRFMDVYGLTFRYGTCSQPLIRQVAV